MKYLETDLGVIIAFMMKYLEWNSFKHTVSLKSYLTNILKGPKLLEHLFFLLNVLYFVRFCYLTESLKGSPLL